MLPPKEILHMNISSPSYTSLQELIVSEQIYRDKSLKLISLILSLENTPCYDKANIFLMTRPRGFGLSLISSAIDKIIKRDNEIVSKIEDGGLLEQIPLRHTIFIDFKHINATNPKELSQALISYLQELFWLHHIETHLNPYMTPKVYFSSLIDALYKRHHEPMAIFIDNCDIPLMKAFLMKDPDDVIEATCIYHDMLNVLNRTSKNKVKWALLTGHIKFNFASEYSEGLPLVEDLSSNESFGDLFGFTKAEIELIFKNRITKFSQSQGISELEYLDRLERCYGGYCFTDKLIKVMCPVCISHVMNNNGLLLPYSANGNYPFLKNVLKKNKNDFDWLFNKNGQDPLYSNSLDSVVKGKQIGTLLIYSGFATRTKVLVNSDEGYTTWRYRFECPNLDMQKTLEFITNKCTSEDLKKPLITNEDPKETSAEEK